MPAKKRSASSQWSLIGLSALMCVATVASMHLAQSKFGNAAAEMLPATERTTVTLPPLQGSANLFFMSVPGAVLSAPAIDAGWNANFRGPAIYATKSDQIFDFSTGKAGPQTDGANPQPSASAGGLIPSPDQTRLAVQVFAGDQPVVWVIDLSNRSQPVMTRLVEEGVGYFLGWHPDSRHVLFAALDLSVSDAGLWEVDLVDGTHRRVEIENLVAPEGLTAAAFSPDGATIAYALTGGMGAGSDVWLVKDGEAPRHVWGDDKTVASSLTFSPDGTHLALVNLLDSPVPFAEAGLWTVDIANGETKFLTVVDGGHGQRPLWSPDSKELYMVKRDNLEDADADYEASKLVSSIHAIGVADLAERQLVTPDGARQVDLSLSPNGDLLFASNRSGVSEIWIVGPDGTLRQVTVDGSPKRFPLFLAGR